MFPDAFAPRKKSKLKMAPKLRPQIGGKGPSPEPNMQMGMSSAKEAMAHPKRGFGK